MTHLAFEGEVPHMQPEEETALAGHEGLIGHRAKLHALSPEADLLLNTLDDAHLTNRAFMEKIADYNRRHETIAPAKGACDSFVFDAGAGRTVTVDMYESGRVVLTGAAPRATKKR